MIRLLLLIVAVCVLGCATEKPVPVAEESLYRSDLPEGTFDAKQFPRIIISGVKLWHDPNMPGWEASGGGYRTVQFNCPVAWMDLGEGRELCDASDFRDETYEPKIGDPANVDGDIQVRHREGAMQIMDGGLWRAIKPGDKLRKSCGDALLGPTAGNMPIGKSNIWVSRHDEDLEWTVYEPSR